MRRTGLAYYNENDPHCAGWLRRLIRAGLIAPGFVDNQSIKKVKPEDLEGWAQCHFFAGIGGWSLALRMARWKDDKQVWTGSCPCQPFSVAGQRKAEKDPRHLWPVFGRLIAQCKPAVVYGEQVASAAGRKWIVGVRDDLEKMGYGAGIADLCAASVGTPHIRQRLYWVAIPYNAERWAGMERRNKLDWQEDRRNESDDEFGAGGEDGTRRMADYSNDRRDQISTEPARVIERGEAKRGTAGSGLRRALGGVGESEPSNWRAKRKSYQDTQGRYGFGRAGVIGKGLGQSSRTRLPPSQQKDVQGTGWRAKGRAVEQSGGASSWLEHPTPPKKERFKSQSEQLSRPSDFWRDFELIPCLDGKSRRIEPGTFPLAHGVPGRVGQLRGYGNAIVPQVAAEFIKASLEVIQGKKARTKVK